ncbi:reverse transcriptase domain-containing protein [Tanacetum coccineum]
MAERTIEELLRAPTEGYGEAIVLPEINADHFEIKTNLLQLVQANPFYGRESENPHAHINRAAKTWYEKEPPNSMLTWEDFVTKFVNQFFPPSKTTHLKNEISRFTQKFEETFSEAWERFKELLRACPHHEFTESNASRMNATSSKTDERIDKLADQLSTLVEIVSKKLSLTALIKAVRNLALLCGGGPFLVLSVGYRYQSGLVAKHGSKIGLIRLKFQGIILNRGKEFSWKSRFSKPQNNHAPNFQNQGFQNQPFQVPNNQVQQEISNDFSSYKRNNDQMLRNMQSQINSLKGDLKNEIQNTIKSQQAVMMNQQTTFQNNLQNMICGLFQNQASTSGTLPSNTIPNPKGEMKAITTRSGVAYEGPSIPTNPSPKEVVERETEEITDKEQTNFQGSTAQIPPPVIPISIPKPDVSKTLPKTTPIPESDILKSLPKPNIPYPSRRDDQKSCDKASNQMEKIFRH